MYKLESIYTLFLIGYFELLLKHSKHNDMQTCTHFSSADARNMAYRLIKHIQLKNFSNISKLRSLRHK